MWAAGFVAGVRAGKSIQASVRRRRPDKVRIQQAHDPAPVLLNLRYSVIRNRDAPEDRRKNGGHQCAMPGWRRCGRPQGEEGRWQGPLERLAGHPKRRRSGLVRLRLCAITLAVDKANDSNKESQYGERHYTLP
jgi:hypothetical protein